MKHEKIYLGYWWQWLSLQSIKNHPAEEFFFMKNEAEQDDENNVASIRKNSVFPGNHYIYPCVNLGSKLTQNPEPLYIEIDNKIVVNINYLKIFEQWKLREISSENLNPDDLKKIFIDRASCLVSDFDLDDLDDADAFLAKQRQMFYDRLSYKI